MYICEKCFNSNSISNYIKQIGEELSTAQRCNHCTRLSKYRIEKYDLRYTIRDIITTFYEHEEEHGLYGSAEMAFKNDENMDIDSMLGGKSLKDICFELFEIDCENSFFHFLCDYSHDGDSRFNDSDWNVWINMGCDWQDIDRINLNWEDLSDRIKTTFSNGILAEANFKCIKEFECLKQTFETLSSMFSETLYRARIIKSNNAEDFKTSPSSFVGMPPPGIGTHNRFSPRSISYGYFSKDNTTIIKEVRAIQGNDIAIGKFRVENLNLVDLRKETLKNILKDPFSRQFTRELLCSNRIIQKFLQEITKPINEEERDLEYLPTQAISMYIRTLGYDGFIYDSSLNQNGENYLLYNPTYIFEGARQITVD